MRIGDKPMTAEQKQMNQKNVSKLLEAFENRSDVVPIIERSLKCDAVMLVGKKAENHVKGLEAIFASCDKTKTSMLKIDGKHFKRLKKIFYESKSGHVAHCAPCT